MSDAHKPLSARQLVEEAALVAQLDTPYILIVAETAWHESAESLMSRALHAVDAAGWRAVSIAYRHYDVLVALCHNPAVPYPSIAFEERSTPDA